MIENTSKESIETVGELSQHYGCYGIKTIDGLNSWIDVWMNNDGSMDVLSNLTIVVNPNTRGMTMWVTEEIFNYEG